MGRTIAGVVAGVVAWVAVALGIALVLGKVAPDLDAALKAHATTTALAERLLISFAGSLVGGYLAARIANARAALICGVLLLAWWGTYHVMLIWHQFPIWYHLTFFVSLPLFAVIGARLAGRR
jgi:hypothetical protein